MAFVVKLAYMGDIRRKRFANPADIAMEDIDAVIRESFALHDYTAKYADDEGDLCTLTALTLTDALNLSQAKRMLRLEIVGVTQGGDDAASSGSWERVEAEDGEVDMQTVASEELQEVEEGVSLELPSNVASYSIHTPDSTPDSTPRQETPGTEGTAEEADPDELAMTNLLALSDGRDLRRPRNEEANEVVDLTAEDEEMPAAGDVDATTLQPWEKIQFVIAAFDANGDGCLNFQECNDLQQAAAAQGIDKDMFKAVCMELGEDESKGFGAESLGKIYERYGNLDRDFEVAVQKLASEQPSQSGGSDHSFGRFAPLLAVPLLSLLPLAGGVGPAAVAGAFMLSRRLRS